MNPLRRLASGLRRAPHDDDPSIASGHACPAAPAAAAEAPPSATRCAAASTPPTALPAPTIAADGLEARLEHLFRDARKGHRIHPLYLPMLKYRRSQAAT